MLIAPRRLHVSNISYHSTVTCNILDSVLPHICHYPHSWILVMFSLNDLQVLVMNMTFNYTLACFSLHCSLCSTSLFLVHAKTHSNILVYQNQIVIVIKVDPGEGEPLNLQQKNNCTSCNNLRLLYQNNNGSIIG